ncbi:MAG: NTP transferase domain-containing protein [Oligoflexia bacterium]|nr:NTP transferase domain-containing protein [Oligoflexia bacterium]
MHKPQVVILAGGLGTRLGDITKEIPKPMVLVSGKPFLEWQIEHLKKHGFTKILLLTGYKSEQIKSYFDNGKKWGVEIEYSVEKDQMGTGGALLQARYQLEGDFLLLFGDSFLPVDYQGMLAMLDHNTDVVMAVYNNKEDTGVPFNVSINTNFFVDTYYKEGLSLPKPEKPLKYVEAGAYLVRKNVIAGQSLKYCSFEAEILKGVIKMHRMKAWISDSRFYDIGTPERLKLFERKIRDYFPNAL